MAWMEEHQIHRSAKSKIHPPRQGDHNSDIKVYRPVNGVLTLVEVVPLTKTAESSKVYAWEIKHLQEYLINCRECGKEFKGDRQTRRYCSKRCRYLAARRKVPKRPKHKIACAICSKKVESSNAKQRTCGGSQCKVEYKRMVCRKAHHEKKAIRTPLNTCP